ncbi:MAG: V-type ATPase subunit, partial [Candidatus Thermoplasmatota archaeon]
MAEPVTPWTRIRLRLRRARRRVRDRIPYESGNYPYVTARVKAKKAALYPADVYPRLLQMEIPQIARLLGEGPYREEIVALGAKVRGVDLVERATSGNLAKVFTHVIAISEGRLREMVSMYLDRWDVANIKTILRGKLYGATAADILEDIVAAGSLDADFLRSLVEMETVGEVFSALKGTIYEEARA